MPPELRKWQCGRCGYVVDLPDHETEYDRFIDAMNRIREHRFAHIVTAFEDGSDAALDRLCEDELAEPVIPPAWNEDVPRALAASLDHRIMQGIPPAQPVSFDDVTPVLEGITELLRADLPRARQLWYPINEDGSFNR